MTKTSLQKDIISQLLYSEIFGYPLTIEELAASHNREAVQNTLNELVDQQLVHSNQEFYFLFEESDKIERRKINNAKARSAMPKALKIARFIQSFPFVEGVGISGSLSKGVLDSEGDFDYFIITRPGRLWIARTILIAYKKIILLNSRKYFCLNYFIDSDHLTIEDQNLFTATEVATLIPVCGDTFHAFQEKNEWISAYGKGFRSPDEIISHSRKRLPARFVQGLFSRSLGEWVDKRCMRHTMKYWKRKFPFFTDEKFDLTLKSRPYISKHHPNDFQSKVLRRYQELHEQYVLQHNLQSLTEATIS